MLINYALEYFTLIHNPVLPWGLQMISTGTSLLGHTVGIKSSSIQSLKDFFPSKFGQYGKGISI